MTEKMLLKSEKYDIPAVFTLPENAEKAPCLIMCHGTGSSKDEAGNQYADLAELLAEKGIASIRFDFAGCGESADSGINQTFMAEVEDTIKAYNYVCDRTEIDTDRIGIIGYSQGGRVMAMIFGGIVVGGVAISMLFTSFALNRFIRMNSAKVYIY